MLTSLKEEILASVTKFCVDPVQRKTMLRALARPGFALDPSSQCRAGILTLNVYAAIKGSIDRRAILGAVAVELYMEAAFMFDNVADQDREDTTLISYPEELALALTLMCCGSAKALESGAMSDSNASSALMHFYKSYSDASAGQFLDASFEKTKRVSVKRALLMTSLKSGSLGQFAAGFGAAITTNDSQLVGLFSKFGHNLLTYMQLVDDLMDALSDGQKNDFLKQKKTVPLVFFSHVASTNEIDIKGDIMPQTPLRSSSRLFKSFNDSGARLFTAVLAETYLNKAKNNLKDLADLGAMVGRIENFVKTVEFSPEELSIAS